MPLQVKLLDDFKHEHETQMWERLAETLGAHFTGKEPTYLFGNAMAHGLEMDALFLKSDGICIIELKAHSGQITFSENSHWYAGDQVIKGGNKRNPWRQVRSNKYALLDFLQEEGMGQVTDQNWGHISGAVVFNPPIELAKPIPAVIRPWFHICDLDQSADVLTKIHSPEITLTPRELEAVASFFGASGTPPQDDKIRLQLHNKSDFTREWKEMRDEGGPAQIAANIFQSFCDKLRNGIDPFTSPLPEPEPRIENLQLHPLGANHVVAVVRNHNVIHLCTIGARDTVDRWIGANQGLTFTLGKGGRMTPTWTNPRPQAPTDLTAEDESWLEQLERLELADYGLAPLIIRLLEGINASTGEDEITETLEAVPEPELRNALASIFDLMRTGDREAAQSRIDLLSGTAIPEGDLGESSTLATDSSVNSDQMVDLVGLSDEDFEKLMDPTRFQDWMLFLHPDQKALVAEDYEKPTILTGVSGSGKTCVLVHRAKRLANLYPDSKIGVLTLNRSLAELIENLVAELCPEAVRERIRVMAFYDYFQKLVLHFGPNLELENLRNHATEVLHNSFLEEAMENLSPAPRKRGRFQSHREKPAPDLWEAQKESVLRTIMRVDPTRYARLFDPLSGETLDETWELFLDQPQIKELFQVFSSYLLKHDDWVNPSKYLREEFSLVRSAAATESRSNHYQELQRSGRAIPFNASMKKVTLALLLLYEETMLHGGILDELGLTLNLLPHLAEFGEIPEALRFRCLLVDEYQDMSTRDLALLRRVIPVTDENALFLTGDTVQRVMVKAFEPAKAALGPQDTVRRAIRKNYRNSRQILLAASNLSATYGAEAEDLGEQIDYLDPELATRQTAWPIATETLPDSEISEAWNYARECIETGHRSAWSVCIVTTCEQTHPVSKILAEKPAGFPFKAARLTGDYSRNKDTMTVSTMSDIKGFEFSMVIVIGCGASSLPSPGTPRKEGWRDALRLYVAMTRARDEVRLLYSGESSEFLTTMNEHLLWEELE